MDGGLVRCVFLLLCNMSADNNIQGTVLEGKLGPSISNSPLWSAHAISNDPEALVQTHLAFLEAGARLISTSTQVYFQFSIQMLCKL